VAAISVDPPDASHGLAPEKGYTFTLLSDPDMNTITQYDLVDPISAAPYRPIGTPVTTIAFVTCRQYE